MCHEWELDAERARRSREPRRSARKPFDCAIVPPTKTARRRRTRLVSGERGGRGASSEPGDQDVMSGGALVADRADTTS